MFVACAMSSCCGHCGDSNCTNDTIVSADTTSIIDSTSTVLVGDSLINE